ncbi:hypothetical protein ERO13_D07G041350v2 [Gossypium hirsutum]|uniref:Uncharacterized protein n=1 Tax=Gossypium darwinii TaxID=34276 RepID=A0A5D2BVM8_GOSDA|nr:hypothetical protein ERO13_D07G041350v2 [Gossypium hirsutum]TYG60153.1 hypothetical protein ES288_D07G045500v1 [Gossypium darwinii]
MLLDPLPTINKAFSMVIQQERQLLDPSSTVFSSNAVRQSSKRPSQASSRSSDSKTDTRKCTFCGGLRQTVDTCYHKNGFPPGYRSRNSTSRVHNVFEEIDTNTVDSVTGYSPPVTSQGSGVTLTQEQITQLLALLLSSSNQSTNHTQSQPTPHLTNQVLATPSLTLASIEGSPLYEDDWYN